MVGFRAGGRLGEKRKRKGEEEETMRWLHVVLALRGGSGVAAERCAGRKSVRRDTSSGDAEHHSTTEAGPEEEEDSRS
ncbi:unnamed protein product [Arctogadus glacialis]